MRVFLIGIVAVGLAGCALPLPLQLASWAASGLSYATTGKSVSDHAVSAVTAKDCAMHRIVMGEKPCDALKPEVADTLVAQVDGAPSDLEPGNATTRLRDSLVLLAENIDDGLQPASGPAVENPNANAPLDDALLAVAETINDIRPAARTEAFVAPEEVAQHYLIIGRFRQMREAEDIRIRHAGLNTSVRMILEDGDLLFQVSAGPFTRPDALDIGATIATGDSSPKIAQLCSDRATPAPCGTRDKNVAIHLTVPALTEE